MKLAYSLISPRYYIRHRAWRAWRKAAGRDRYERDLALQARVRDSYLRQARAGGWLRLDGERDRAEIAREIVTAVDTRLGRR